VINNISFGLVGAAGAFVSDQLSKFLVVANASKLSSGISILPGFNLVYHRNSGVTFGMLNGVPWWGLVLLALLVCLWLMVMLVRSKVRTEAFAYGLIIGGALGNVLDRIRAGAVTDFLDIFVGELHWPAFNLADTAIFSGVALLIALPLIQKTQV